jgi:acetyltransferase-like isoleucine patch superfamily enzyme
MPFFKKITNGKLEECTKKIIVFGNGGQTRTVYGYFFDEHKVEGFVVDDKYVSDQPSIGELPVHPFSKITEIYPPEQYSVLVALGFKDLNQLRQKKSEELSTLGYEFVSFIDRSVRVPCQYSIGSNSIVVGHADIHEGVVIKEGVFVSSGAVLGHDSILENYSWIGSGAVLTGWVTIGDCTVLGMNVSIKQNSILGHHTLVSPNSFVKVNTPPYSSIVSEAGKLVPIDSRRLHMFAYK